MLVIVVNVQKKIILLGNITYWEVDFLCRAEDGRMVLRFALSFEEVGLGNYYYERDSHVLFTPAPADLLI